MELTDRHVEILRAVGELGATEEELGRVVTTREFDDLRSAGFLLYWPARGLRPLGLAATGSRRDCWYLSFIGAGELGLDLPFFRTA
jgi:hypothetical protein